MPVALSSSWGPMGEDHPLSPVLYPLCSMRPLPLSLYPSERQAGLLPWG